MSTQPLEPVKRSWRTREDEPLGQVARLADWVRRHRLSAAVIVLALAVVAAAVVAGFVNLTPGGQSGNAEACTDYYNAQSFVAAGDTNDAGSRLDSMFAQAARITSPALSQAIHSFEGSEQIGAKLTPGNYSNKGVATACASLGLGNSASN